MNQFTADQHFNDNNILRQQSERFELFGRNNKIVTKSLINRQNCQVSSDDTVYMLGDFIIANNLKSITNIVSKLNGKIVLILGNHDHILKDTNIGLGDKFKIVNDIYELILYNGFMIQMYHYPLLEQPNYHMKHSYHLYGHVHGARTHPDKKAFDISCNIHNFNLLSEAKIIDMITASQIN